MAGTSRKERDDRDLPRQADTDRHKATAHYQKWRDTVSEMMAEPRSSVKCPDDEGWG
jgi:hypothetical protein